MVRMNAVAGWGDMDFNSHMRNTAYLDKSADVRLWFFSHHGFPIDEFARLKLGPVVMKDELIYFKEINLLDNMEISLGVAGLSGDGSRHLFRNEFFRGDGKRAATVNSLGGWLDLVTRRFITPPARLLTALTSLPKTEDFAVLPSNMDSEGSGTLTR
jgi:acyl-CoA thioester hydrolase